MKRVLQAFLLAAIAVCLCAQSASAIPVFARKYGVQCTMCHSNMPRLNDFGERFRMNGYRLPGRENEEKTVLDSPAPIAFRTSAGYAGSDSSLTLGSGTESDFRLNGVDILSGGLLGSRIGYIMVYVPQIRGSRGVAGQDGAFEMGNIVFSDLATSWLNVRAGRFEPAFVAFSVKRQLSVSPYEIYDHSFPGGPLFSETRSGVELSGYGRTALGYAAGVVSGSETNRAFDTPSDVYARAVWVFGAGEGQTAGQRIGALGYLGRARPRGASPAKLEDFSRWGLDASLNAAHANLALQYLWARDNEALWNSHGAVDYSGGFAELSFLPMVKLVGFARFDLVNASSLENRDITRWTAGARFYAEDNVALHGEYSYRRIANVIDTREGNVSSVTAKVDFAF